MCDFLDTILYLPLSKLLPSFRYFSFSSPFSSFYFFTLYLFFSHLLIFLSSFLPLTPPAPSLHFFFSSSLPLISPFFSLAHAFLWKNRGWERNSLQDTCGLGLHRVCRGDRGPFAESRGGYKEGESASQSPGSVHSGEGGWGATHTA